MDDENKQEQRKKIGFIPWIKQKLGIGSRGRVGTAGPSSGALASSENIAANIGKIAVSGRIIPQSTRGLAGLFSNKAGVVGVILGAATIAAGIGVLYNFIGPSSKPVYSPGLFQDSFLKSQSEQASQERAAMDNYSASSLDFFKEQTQKELGTGTEDSQKDDQSQTGDEEANASVPDESNVPQAASSGANQVSKLQTSAGFGTGTQIPRMSSGGNGLFGGIGGTFQGQLKPKPQPVSKKSSTMKRALAANIVQSKQNLPKYNKKGAYGQAKYAAKLGGQIPFSAGDAGARTTATEAFSGETGGAGDVGMPVGGVGTGGQGLGSVPGLRGNDPNMSNSQYQPGQLDDYKKPDEIEKPWEKFMNWAIYAGIASMALILLTKLLARGMNPLMYKLAYITAYAAIAAAAVVVAFGVYMVVKWKQALWTGIPIILVGLGLMIAAIRALKGVGEAEKNAIKTDLNNSIEKHHKILSDPSTSADGVKAVNEDMAKWGKGDVLTGVVIGDDGKIYNFLWTDYWQSLGGNNLIVDTQLLAALNDFEKGDTIPKWSLIQK